MDPDQIGFGFKLIRRIQIWDLIHQIQIGSGFQRIRRIQIRFGSWKMKIRSDRLLSKSDLIRFCGTLPGGHNIAQTIFNSDRWRDVFFYNWTEYLVNYFNPVSQIKKHHYFVLNRDKIGIVEIKIAVNEGSQLINLTKKDMIQISYHFLKKK